jgi:hypothetical protein
LVATIALAFLGDRLRLLAAVCRKGAADVVLRRGEFTLLASDEGIVPVDVELAGAALLALSR